MIAVPESSSLAMPGHSRRRTASLPLAYDPRIHQKKTMEVAFLISDGLPGQARIIYSLIPA
jgi:hypothetical protein